MHKARTSARQLAQIDGTLASDHLNLIRGLSAIAVLLAHVRWRFFLDYRDILQPGLLQRGFYAVTSLGHDAVMIFFVVSGFFISASVIRDMQNGRWSFKRYFTNRCVRLYVVLLPGLLLTALWDWTGLTYFGDNAVYSGAEQSWQHNYFPVENRLGIDTLLGNMLFLQTICVQPFGSNEALWSLSNEFWYYMLFPCLWVAFSYRAATRSRRMLYLTGGLVLLFVLSRDILLYFPVWLLGTGLTLLAEARVIRRHRRAMTALMVVVFFGTLGLCHRGAVREAMGAIVVLDYLEASVFAMLLYVVLHARQPSTNGRYAAISRWLANFSYTLYVVHLPLLVFLHALLVYDRPWLPDPVHIGIATVLGIATVGYAWFLAQLTEAKTEVVRDIANRWLARITPKMFQPLQADRL